MVQLIGRSRVYSRNNAVFERHCVTRRFLLKIPSNRFNSLLKVNPSAKYALHDKTKTPYYGIEIRWGEGGKKGIKRVRWSTLDQLFWSYRGHVQKFAPGRSIDGPIKYLIGYASVIERASKCELPTILPASNTLVRVFARERVKCIKSSE